MTSVCLKGARDDSTMELMLHTSGGGREREGTGVTAPNVQLKGPGAWSAGVSGTPPS